MKKALSVLGLLLLLNACKSPSQPVPFERTGAVTFTGKEEMGTIMLYAEGIGSNLEEAIGHAERNALENLLFKGIPGSNQRQPLVPSEQEALSKNPAYFENLIRNRGYQRFVMESSIRENRSGKESNWVKQFIKFDLANLRKDLEQHNIIRKFGI